MSTRKRQRPWTVFVRDIGPTYTYASEEKARAKAESLIGEYAEVLVWDRLDRFDSMVRWVYRYDKPMVKEWMDEKGRWHPA